MLYYNGYKNVSEAVGADHRPNASPTKYPPDMQPEEQQEKVKSEAKK